MYGEGPLLNTVAALSLECLYPNMTAMTRGNQVLSLGCSAVSQSHMPGLSAVAIHGPTFYPELMFQQVPDVIALRSPLCPWAPMKLMLSVVFHNKGYFLASQELPMECFL